MVKRFVQICYMFTLRELNKIMNTKVFVIDQQGQLSKMPIISNHPVCGVIRLFPVPALRPAMLDAQCRDNQNSMNTACIE